jgi:CheY-like chemotaxis protein
MLRVLVVDDDPDTVASLRPLLKAWGYESRSALDGQAALDAAEVWPPDVVLLDLAMPGMSGYEVARQLRQGSPDRLSIICMSGYGTEGDRRRSQEAGCDHHLLKPADPWELRRLLKSRRSAVGQDQPAG